MNQLKDILARIERRLAARGLSATAASQQAGLSLDSIRNMRRAVDDERTSRVGVSTATLTALAPVLGTTASWLLEGVGPEGEPLVPIIGRVGMLLDGTVIPKGHGVPLDMIPPPPGVSREAAAIEVKGHALKGFADDGALIYYDAPQPADSLLGEAAVLKIEDGPLMVARLLRGDHPGVYDIEPLSAPALNGLSVEWAAPIAAVITPTAAANIDRRPDPGSEGISQTHQRA